MLKKQNQTSDLTKMVYSFVTLHSLDLKKKDFDSFVNKSSYLKKKFGGGDGGGRLGWPLLS